MLLYISELLVISGILMTVTTISVQEDTCIEHAFYLVHYS